MSIRFNPLWRTRQATSKIASEIRSNLVASVKSYDQSLARLAERLEDLKQYDHKAGSTEDLEVQIRIRLEELQNRGSLFSLDQFKADRTTSRGELVAMEADIEKDKAKIAAIGADTNELERLLLKYEFPKRSSCEFFEPYLARIWDFMAVTWQAPAVSKRQKGHKSLLEWAVELDSMPPDQWGFQQNTSEQLKGLLIELGLNISKLLLQYLWKVTALHRAGEVVERLEEVRSVIGSLGIEQGSAVIECFLKIAELFARTVGTHVRAGPDMKRAPWGEEEAEVFRMITVEILRMEVAFISPELPTRVQNSTYIYMAWHLRNAVFRDNLDTIWEKIDDFNSPKQPPTFLETETIEIWLGRFNALQTRNDQHGEIQISFKS